MPSRVMQRSTGSCASSSCTRSPASTHRIAAPTGASARPATHANRPSRGSHAMARGIHLPPAGDWRGRCSHDSRRWLTRNARGESVPWAPPLARSRKPPSTATASATPSDAPIPSDSYVRVLTRRPAKGLNLSSPSRGARLHRATLRAPSSATHTSAPPPDIAIDEMRTNSWGLVPAMPIVDTCAGASSERSKTTTLEDSGSCITSRWPSASAPDPKWLCTPSRLGSTTRTSAGSGSRLTRYAWTRRSKGSQTSASPDSASCATATG